MIRNYKQISCTKLLQRETQRKYGLRHELDKRVQQRFSPFPLLKIELDIMRHDRL